MQKKLIALAVAGLLSAPAFAQSNVTLYGTLDYGFVSLGNSSYDNHRHQTGVDEDDNPTFGPWRGKFKSRNAIDSGISKFNRIGFKGVEDLGNGLKAVFVLENGLAGDRTGGAGIFNNVNRQSYAALAGGFGTVAFGRHYTPQHLFSAAVDPFGKNGIGGLNNSLVQDVRLDNLAAYISPSWGGFSFVAGYTFNGIGNEALENNGDARVWAIAPNFTWNNLFVAANYHEAKLNNAHGSNTKVFNVMEGYASYDFGFVKLGALAGRRTTKKELYAALGAPTNKDVKLTQFMLGATFKITENDKVMTSYTRAYENKLVSGEAKRRLSQWAVGYEHALSKRTALYAIGAFQSQSDAYRDFGGFRSFAGVGGGPGVGSVGNDSLNYGAAALYKRGVGVGLRHDF